MGPALRTLAILKPDATRRKLAGSILNRIEQDFKIKLVQSIWMSVDRAATFYLEHEEKPYFHDLINFMSSGLSISIVIQAPPGGDAVLMWRQLMGPFDPTRQEPGQIRFLFRDSNPVRSKLWSPSVENLVHGSDSLRSYIRETTVLRLGERPLV